jgi:hypothetical protein
MFQVQVNRPVNAAKLREAYDRFFFVVLGDRLEALDLDDEAPSAYRVVKPLPSKAEYAELRKQRFTTNVNDLIVTAYEALYALQEELEESFDRLMARCHSASIREQLEEATQEVARLDDEPDCPAILQQISVYREPSLGPGTAKLAAEAADMLRTAARAIEEWLGEEGLLGSVEDRQELASVAKHCALTAEQLDAVEFPE